MARSDPRAQWRKDEEFIRLARKLWPQELRISERPDMYNRRVTALQRLRERHIGFRAAREEQQA